MQNWTSGYVADIGYTFGYYTELNPFRSRLALLNAGILPPKSGTHCELGFGQGLSVNIHSAASDDAWFGTDFNPAQACFAQDLVSACANGAQLFDQSFAEFCTRSDLPDFDSIGLHGIWSWISDENREHIMDFIRRKLKVGGVVYVSYNTQPGWAAMVVPMRELLTVHANRMGADGKSIITKIDEALDFAMKLIGANPAFAKANPQIAERLKKINEQDRSYLAHEYFNRDWVPMSFAEMSKWMSAAKMEFACSANYLDAIDAINLTQAQIDILSTIDDVIVRQITRDFCVNQQFRKDYWIKGVRKMSAFDRANLIRSTRVIMCVPRSDVGLKINSALGEATLAESVYGPILDLLADHKPHSIGELENKLGGSGIVLNQLVQATLVLTGMSVLAEVQDDAKQIVSRSKTDKLNSYLMEKAQSSKDIPYLASPVTGGGVAVGRFAQLFLLARERSKGTVDECVNATWKILASQNQRLVKEGKVLETEQDNVNELRSQAMEFEIKNLPILQSLGIAY
jgi:SAM-dependent methyltransferase